MTVTHRQEQAERTPGICPPHKALAPRVKEPLREKPVMVSTPISRALAQRLHLGQKQDMKQLRAAAAAMEDKDSLPKGVDFICNRAWRSLNLRVLSESGRLVHAKLS